MGLTMPQHRQAPGQFKEEPNNPVSCFHLKSLDFVSSMIHTRLRSPSKKLEPEVPGP